MGFITTYISDKEKEQFKAKAESMDKTSYELLRDLIKDFLKEDNDGLNTAEK